MAKKTILFHPFNATALREFEPLIERAKESGIAVAVNAEGERVIVRSPREPASVADRGPVGGPGIFRVIRDFFAIMLRLALARRRARKLLDTHAPGAVVVAGDRHLPFEVALVAEARARRVPVVIPPGAYSDVPSLSTPRSGRPEYSIGAHGFLGGLNAWVARRYPAQARTDGSGDRTLFYPAATTLALAANGILPHRPWCLGASGADLVCVAGTEAHDRYVEDGLPSERVRITGHPAADALYRAREERTARKAEIEKRFGLKSGRELWIFAPPQLGEHRQTDWETHWRFMDFAWSTLSAAEANVVCSLHPKSDPERYRALSSKHGMPILERPLREVLPCADRYWATFSSTVEWAILCRVPCEIVDFWGLGTATFYQRYSLRVARNEAEFRSAAASSPAASPSAEVTEGIGRFDGRSIERVLAAIAEAAPT